MHSNTWNHLILLTRETELLEIELVDHLTVYLQNLFTNHIFDIYVKTGFGIK